jgi:glycerol-3-phosphate acyltransferase PlsY
MELALWFLGAYLAGAIPTSYILGKMLKGIDIREHGSGNAGATNVFRVLGPAPAVVTLLVDALKGYIPVALTLQHFDVQVCAVVGLCAIVGHIWSVFLKFRGGKGVATAAGVFLALLPEPTLFAVGVFTLVLLFTRYVSLGSILAAVTLVTYTWLRNEPLLLSVLATVAGLLIIFRHRSNIVKLIRGEENRFGKTGGNEQ